MLLPFQGAILNIPTTPRRCLGLLACWPFRPQTSLFVYNYLLTPINTGKSKRVKIFLPDTNNTLYNFFNDSLLAFRVLLLVVRNSFSDIDRSRFACLPVVAFVLRIMTKCIKFNTNCIFFVVFFVRFKIFM